MFARRRYKRGMNHKKMFVYTYIVFIFILLLAIYGFLLVDRKIKPTVLTIAEIKARQIASTSINESINKMITDDIRYQDLYFIRTDSEGNITFMQANSYMTKLLKILCCILSSQKFLYLGFLHPTQFFLQ
ncbi:MAG: hypothetical protein MJA82_18070 [Clostridia bacterium]|nr:hypothetical protein [Clostridia bacterium]